MSKARFTGRKVVNTEAKASSSQVAYLQALAGTVSSAERWRLYGEISGTDFHAVHTSLRWKSLTRGQASDLIAQYKRAAKGGG